MVAHGTLDPMTQVRTLAGPPPIKRMDTPLFDFRQHRAIYGLKGGLPPFCRHRSQVASSQTSLRHPVDDFLKGQRRLLLEARENMRIRVERDRYIGVT